MSSRRTPWTSCVSTGGWAAPDVTARVLGIFVPLKYRVRISQPSLAAQRSADQGAENTRSPRSQRSPARRPNRQPSRANRFQPVKHRPMWPCSSSTERHVAHDQKPPQPFSQRSTMAVCTRPRGQASRGCSHRSLPPRTPQTENITDTVATGQCTLHITLRTIHHPATPPSRYLASLQAGSNQVAIAPAVLGRSRATSQCRQAQETSRAAARSRETQVHLSIRYDARRNDCV
jgi:hypothetical protein